jgi:DNA-binding NarL/FixJ family response regulator
MKILIVDDHSVVRHGIAALLGDLARTVIEAADHAGGLAQCALHPDIDIILLDLFIPGGGPAAIRDYRALLPKVPVVILSSSENASDVRETLASGARGYIPKSTRPETMRAAIELVRSGAVYVPPLVLDDLAAAPDGGTARSQLLTPRQFEVLERIADGQSNKAIGIQLGMADKTVKAHVSAIFRALNVVNRTQAANAARTLGLNRD